MSRFFLEADSLNTEDLRALLAVHHRICKGTTPAGGHEQKEFGGAGLVRAIGPESWNC